MRYMSESSLYFEMNKLHIIYCRHDTHDVISMLIHVNKASKTKFLNLDKNQLLKCQILQKFLKAKLSYKVMIQHLTCSDFKNSLC